MRILTLSNCDLVESQGSGYVIVNFARELRSRQHTVTLLGPGECILWPRLKKARSLRLALGMRRKALQLARALRPDVIEFWGGEAWLATARLARLPGRTFRIVARSNGLEPFVAETLARHGIPNTADGRPARWYQGRMPARMNDAFTKADALVTVSEAEAEHARGRALNPRVLAIENALPDEFLDQPFVLAREKTVGFCGSWIERKGASLIVRDMTEVLRARRDWTLHLVGVGDGFDLTRHFPDDLRAQIRVTGRVDDKRELRRVYAGWSIAIIPSIYESFGLVAAEAMACGCALVASRTGFATALRPEEEALVIAPRSPALRDAVLRLMSDEALRGRIAIGGWSRVQPLRWSRNGAALEQFYEELCTHR